MRRLLLSLAAVLGLATTLLAASPAQAATYGVSMYYSAPKADVGQTIKISGVVSGSKSTDKTLTVQRKVGSGSWANVGTVKTGSNAKYYFFHQVSAVGGQQFRVVAPKNGSTAQGISTPKGFVGWTWLNLTQQPHIAFSTGFWGATACSAGACMPRSITGVYDSGSVAKWRLDGKCDNSDLRFAVPDGSSTQNAYSVTVQAIGQTATAYNLSVGSWTTTPNQVSSAVTQLHLIKNHGSGTALSIGTPRLHCSVAELPSY